ncbi:BufA2 family periplasmic bufferin-type metallophore [Marinobacterium jannaschii]|uniref:BufA2 family periplasmic bufferin-type metallophore n=1 Tax=Marinobacterium jannaschii TaxID=64970 RepID=UPI0004872CF3|nr:hypothetical protein [Marinobacterium jannaschii]
MKTNLSPKLGGISVALAAAGLAACSSTAPKDNSQAYGAADAESDLIHCYGVNKCKGHNDCGGANNACGGQGSCKGSGFVGMPSKACADVGGRMEDDWRGAIAKADLTQCFGVNQCKGHNDCKTASNSCAGQASCKGQGFVMTTAKSCEAIGGSTS